MESKTPRVRFAPSPTGTLHTGGVRTALFNYLFAKQKGGQFILRIDDTDKIRSTKEFEQDILSGLKWIGLDYDEIYYQSQRAELYKKNLRKLLDENKVYVSKEEIKKEGDLPEVIRFRNPNKKVKFTDLIKGEIEFDTTDLGDFVVAKDLTTPLYHFASIVDDADLQITHVIRGEDHISNTPRQILMWEALGAPVPEFAHLPLILAPDRSKLSKRKHADIASLNKFIEHGYLPEAIINFVALLGWNPGTEQELFTLPELVTTFDIKKVQKSSAVFNLDKLNWFNREYFKKMSDQEFSQLTGVPINLASELKSRATTITEAK
jgi:glutamyl/glutaminyl-tRNA synthetase